MSRTAVLSAVASLLACSGFALADSPKLTLDPTVITRRRPSQGLLMQGLDKCGVGKTLSDLKLNIYGWVESGYTYDHRHSSYNAPSGAFPRRHLQRQHLDPARPSTTNSTITTCLTRSTPLRTPVDGKTFDVAA